MKIFDIETDGLLDQLTKVHILSVFDTETKKAQRFITPEAIKAYVMKHFDRNASEPLVAAGHNIIAFDLPALQKVYPEFTPHAQFYDTLCLSRLVFTDLFDSDMKLTASGKLPRKFTGSHSLEAWGYRLGDYKGDFKGPWREEDVPVEQREAWLTEMYDYCEQDTRVTAKLWKKLKTEEYSKEAVELEHSVQWIIQRQIRYGVAFNEAAAQEFYATLLVRRDELTRDLQETFGKWFERDGRDEFVPKKDNPRLGYTEGCPFSKIKEVTFNPGSRQHIAKRLKKMYGWEPTSFTETGLPEVNEKVLKGLASYPPVAKLLEYLMVDKRIGQVAEGDNGWLKMVRADGRIHGNVNTNGAVTGRMTHSSPNLAQVPSGDSPYGHECRALFVVPKGKKLVGADASALEGRTLAHYTSRYDGGEYGKVLLEGDVHWENCIALELVPRGTKRNKDEDTEEGQQHKTIRGIAKTWFYAWLYGAGDKKLAVTLGCSEAKAKRLREAFLRNATALGALQADIAVAVKANGHLKGLDRRILHVRSEHSALNTLLQSAGAIIMKRALVILDRDLQAQGWVPGVNYEFVLNVHDEWQIEADEDIAEEVAAIAVAAIRKAGKYYQTRVPMDGDARVGVNWSETH